jgi:chaperonin GroES
VASTRSPKVVQQVPTPEPHAFISTDTDRSERHEDEGRGIEFLHRIATAGGDICDLLDEAEIARIGLDAVREWEMDDGTRSDWKEITERSLADAAQEPVDGEDSGVWENSADIHYPLLTTASQQFAARAAPELIRGDKVVGVKVFWPPSKKPDPIQLAKDAPQPQNPQEAQQAGAQIQADQQQENLKSAAHDARTARAERVKHYLNWLVFYQMDDWEGDTDLLLHQIPITGAAFKKVYMGTTGLCSDYVSAMRLTVNNDTKSLARCPRTTQDFEVYPYEIEDRIRAGIYREVDLPDIGEDPEAPRQFIEQHRLDDLDGDGLAEPYIVTVDVETRTTMRIEPAFDDRDVIVDGNTNKVIRIDRWKAFAPFTFLPDPRGKFYGIGFGRLLDSITDSVDTAINQLIDAGTAQIAGGGFIGGGVRLQGSGQGGNLYFRPGEYQTVSTQGNDLREAIWERTVPQPSAVTMQMLELLLAAAKDISSVKDVITGEAPSTAPVGTTLALQNQALQVYSSIYKRIWRGFREEFQLMYHCLRRWGTDRERKQYQELTGGDFDQDFSGDGTDIQPVADPSVVTKMQKMARLQTVLQLAETDVGKAAGMTQPQPAQAFISDALDVLDIDRPERFLAPVGPDPLMQAKAADLTATAQLKTAEASAKGADAGLARAKSLRELGLAAKDSHDIHTHADRIARTGSMEAPDHQLAERGHQLQAQGQAHDQVMDLIGAAQEAKANEQEQGAQGSSPSQA